MKNKNGSNLVLSLIILILPFNLFAQNSFTSYKIPELFLSESTAVMRGEFDGISGNTTILFKQGDVIFEAEVITETRSEIKISTPPEPGIYILFIDDESANTFVETEVRVSEMELSTGKTNLKRGQKTKLNISLHGLNGYEKPIRVNVKNKSPRTVSLPGSNDENYTLPCNPASSSVSKQIDVTGITKGAFNIEVNLVPIECIIHYDPDKMDEEFKKALKNPSADFEAPELDTFYYFKELLSEIIEEPPKPRANDYATLVVKLKEAFDDQAKDPNNEIKRPFPPLELLKWLKKFLENNPLDSLRSVPNSGNSRGPTTTSGRPKPPGYGKGRNNPTTCSCGISGAIYHKPPLKDYQMCKLLSDVDVMKKFREKNIKIPQKAADGFRGGNVSLVPGTAYACNYGDVVGGYANAVANMWGKDVDDNAAVGMNFETELIQAVAAAKGVHYIKITPAKNEWSLVIGVAAVRSATNAKALDPIEFERVLMKEFGRGKRTAEIGFMAFGIASTSGLKPLIEGIAQLIVSTTADLTGITARKKKRVTSNADLYSYARTKYSVNVNGNPGNIDKESWAREVAKIDRHLKIKELVKLKPTEINTKGSSQKEARQKQRTVVISATHPTKVTATITGKALLKCKALGNGVAESSVESKTATCIVGVCVNKDGAMSIKRIHDSSLFILSGKGEKIAKTEISKFEKKIGDYFSDLETKLKGKSATVIKEHIKGNMEDDLKQIARNWVNH